jgi:hypothetical protein
VEISYKLVNGLMKLEVSDNGVGRTMAAITKDKRVKKKSISTEVVKSRLDYFRKVMKSRKISYEIKDLFENSKPAGTRVVIVMPVKKVFA